MLENCRAGLAIASLLLVSVAARAQFADAIIDYVPGDGVTTEYADPKSALGEPSRVTPDPFGGPVDPFSPPWQSGQLVALGTNGALTVKFNTPVRNDATNPFGIDFLIFGNAGFVITNGNFSGGGITDGSLFGASTGTARLSVSADNITFFPLNPSLAPAMDQLFPIDGTGDFQVPPDPALRARDFAGRNLAGIRELYRGSGGGAGFDIDWAQDATGQTVSLPEISYIRIEMSNGIAEIDGFAAVRPVAVPAITVQEEFATDPLQRGWRIFGHTELFQWSPTEQALEVTWDSSKPNSYFSRPLGTVVNRNDDFSFAFDLHLRDIAAGVSTNRPSTFPLAVGLQNYADATLAAFDRSTGLGSPNLVEFSYFPDTGFGPTVWPAIWSTNSTLNYNGISDFLIFNLPVGVPMRITMEYSASNATLNTLLTTNGVPAASLNPVKLAASFPDFRVDAFAVSSYHSPGPDSEFAGSLLAHGVIDNVVVTVPAPPIASLQGRLVDGSWQVKFLSRSNWGYTLEATEDFTAWTAVSTAQGNDGELTLTDSKVSDRRVRFYRVMAQRTE